MYNEQTPFVASVNDPDRMVFPGIEVNVASAPMAYPLNIVSKPDPDVKAVRPSLYAKDEKKSIAATFNNILNSEDETQQPK